MGVLERDGLGCAPQKLDSARPELVTRLLAGCGIRSVVVVLRIVVRLLADLAGLIAFSVRPRQAIEAENLVLRRQLALFKEWGMKPRRIDAATRASLALLSRLCDWRSCLVVVRPETVLR